MRPTRMLPTIRSTIRSETLHVPTLTSIYSANRLVSQVTRVFLAYITIWLRELRIERFRIHKSLGGLGALAVHPSTSLRLFDGSCPASMMCLYRKRITASGV